MTRTPPPKTGEDDESSPLPRLRGRCRGHTATEGVVSLARLPAFGDRHQTRALLHQAFGRDHRLEPAAHGLARLRAQVLGQMAEGVADVYREVLS